MGIFSKVAKWIGGGVDAIGFSGVNKTFAIGGDGFLDALRKSKLLTQSADDAVRGSAAKILADPALAGAGIRSLDDLKRIAATATDSGASAMGDAAAMSADAVMEAVAKESPAVQAAAMDGLSINMVSRGDALLRTAGKDLNSAVGPLGWTAQQWEKFKGAVGKNKEWFYTAGKTLGLVGAGGAAVYGLYTAGDQLIETEAEVKEKAAVQWADALSAIARYEMLKKRCEGVLNSSHMHATGLKELILLIREEDISLLMQALASLEYDGQ